MTDRSLLHPARYPDETQAEYRARRIDARIVLKAYLKGRPIKPPLRPRASK